MTARTSLHLQLVSLSRGHPQTQKNNTLARKGLFNLIRGPGVLDLGESVLNVVFVANPVEDVLEGVFVVRHVGELDTVAHWEASPRRSVLRQCLCGSIRSDRS